MDGEKMSTESAEVKNDEDVESLIRHVYYAARDGMHIALYVTLGDKTPEQINYVMNQKVSEDDGQLCTPFIIAARYGHDKVIRTILDKFKPDLEQEGTVKYDGNLIEGASALWCSAAAGHFNVVKTLVRAGANINHATKTNSTPVRAACFDGHLEIVKYLVEHSADINIANKFNNTCLMIAAYKGYTDVATLLLGKGADPNQQAHCGATALHFAAESGHADIAAELLKNGAQMIKNANGVTPLIVAAARAQAAVVECFVEKMKLSKEELIDIYELLGASLATNKKNFCLISSFKYMDAAMRMRHADPKNIITKKLGDPIPAYDNWRESETLPRLETIQFDLYAIQMESLAIRERILGPANPEVPHSVIYAGATFAIDARFDRCIELWLHALNLKQTYDKSVVKDLLRFAQIFSQMLHVGMHLHFPRVISVLEASVAELIRNHTNITHSQPDSDMDQLVEELESNMATTLYILTILTKLMAQNGNRYKEEDVSKAHQLVHKLCSMKLTLKNGQTFLHLAVNAGTPVDDYHTNDVCKYPCAATTKLLVKCGADVNAMDNERNTALHVIVSYKKPISDFMTLHSIIMDLIDAGAHMDIVNSNGKTPYDVVTTGVAEMILRTQTKLSLKCIAAKAVKSYNLCYFGNVPRALESFIELHGPGLTKGPSDKKKKLQ